MPAVLETISKELFAGVLLIVVSSYLLGSLNFGVILSNHFAKDDVRNHGSGNAGTTNMLRSYGKKLALVTILGDMVKVAVSILIAYAILKLLGIYDVLEQNFGNEYQVYVKSFSGFFFRLWLFMPPSSPCFCGRFLHCGLPLIPCRAGLALSSRFPFTVVLSYIF